MSGDEQRSLGALLGRVAALLEHPDLALPAELLERCRQRVRVLASRLGGDLPCLVVGIVGPNNAGKSALFSLLTGTAVSPSSPAGGATRNLVGALHPHLLAFVESGPLAERFRIVRDGAARAALGEPQPGSLFLVESERVPPHLVVIDSPDFDTVVEHNRETAEGLLHAADVLFVVVTKHTYANAAVRTELAEGRERGRPYFVLYNEATDARTAARHVDDMVGAVGHPPLGRYVALQDVRVQTGEAPLRPVRIETGEPLELAHLRADDVRELLRRAKRADLRALREDVAALGAAWRASARQATRFAERARVLATSLGRRIAEDVVPLEPLTRAFRDALDRRSRGHATARRAFGGVSTVLRAPSRLVRTGVKHALGRTIVPRIRSGAFIAHEHDAIDRHQPIVLERLVTLALDEAEGGPLAEDLRADLADPEALRRRVTEALRALPPPYEEHRRFCETLVEQALVGRERDVDLQWKVTSLEALPTLGLGGFVLFTGGLGGEDLLAAAAASATSSLTQRLVRALGGHVLASARDDWIGRRGEQLARTCLAAALPRTWARLEAGAARWSDAERLLAEAEQRLGRESEGD